MDSQTATQLSVSIGQHSTAGRKPSNQDFFGALIPDGVERTLKGITLAIADGISSSPVSHEAAETIVKALMTDYYCTSDAWTVKTAASRVISATNSWLYAQNRRAHVEDMDRGRVCTLSALIFKGCTAHLFHVGDSRIWRLSGDTLEQLTLDHRIQISADDSYLERSVGSTSAVKIDYRQHPLEPGDVYILTTDGVHEFWDPGQVTEMIAAGRPLDDVAERIVETCLDNGSDDNLTVQIARIESLPLLDDGTVVIDEALNLPFAELPKDGSTFDGFRIVRPLASTARSHIYLAVSPDGQNVVLKFPSVDMRDSADYLRRFVMEEWIARRIQSPHVLAPAQAPQQRSALYTVTEFVEGQTLRQWMTDNPKPSLETVRKIIEQIALGLRAFHRREMLHQDLRPENVIIDDEGTVKIIDFGSTKVAGVQEIAPGYIDNDILGTVQYTAPEYFLGYDGTQRSDLYALGVMAYEMLTGQLPYGGKASHVRTPKDLNRLTVRPTQRTATPLPDWIEYAIGRAIHPDSTKRYESFSEFLEDLRKPSQSYQRPKGAPLMERNPVLFWQVLTIIFALISAALFVMTFTKA